MTFCSRGSPVSWDEGSKSNRGGKGKAPLGKRVLLGGRAPLSKKVVF